MEYDPSKVSKRVLLKVLNDLDRYIRGIQRKIRLYPIGGTKLTLDDVKFVSKDIDVITPRKDFRVISDFVGNLAIKKDIRIDLFPDAQMFGYTIPFYEEGARRYPLEFDNLEILSPNKAVFCLTKGLTGRKRDIEELAEYLSKNPVPLSRIKEEYSRLRINPKSKDAIQQKLEDFIKACYGDTPLSG